MEHPLLRKQAAPKKANAPLTAITATYHSNYNGLSLMAEVNGERYGLQDDYPDPEVRRIAEECAEEILGGLVDDCDEDGEFQGDLGDAQELIELTVKKYFGGGVEVLFEEDGFST